MITCPMYLPLYLHLEISKCFKKVPETSPAKKSLKGTYRPHLLQYSLPENLSTLCPCLTAFIAALHSAFTSTCISVADQAWGPTWMKYNWFLYTF